MGERKRRHGKQRAGRDIPRDGTARRSYWHMLDEGHDLHPVDAVVERRLGHTALRRQIHAATERLLRALGEERHLWLRLEELLGDCRVDREAAFFDIGYNHGRVAGRTEGLAEGKPRASPAYRALVLRAREAAVNAGLPHTHAAAALLDAAWAVVLDLKVPRRQVRRPRRSGRRGSPSGPPGFRRQPRARPRRGPNTFLRRINRSTNHTKYSSSASWGSSIVPAL